MDPNTTSNSGLSEAMAERVRAMHPELTARHAHETPKIREAIQTLLNTDTDAIFLHFLDILPCLEKLGNDFLKFKKPSMLNGDYDDAASSLDLYVGAYQKDIQILQRYFIPKLRLPLPEEYTRPREAALAYAQECNPFKPQTLGTPQRQAELVQRLQAGSLIPNPFPYLPSASQPNGNTDQRPRNQERGATIPPLQSPVKTLKKTRRIGTRVTQACHECKRRKVKCGESQSCIHLIEQAKQTRKAASFSGQFAFRPSPESPIEPSPTYSEESPVLQSPLEYDTFGGFGIAPRDLAMEYEAQDRTSTMPTTQATSTQVSPIFDNDGAYGQWLQSDGASRTFQTNARAQGVTQNTADGFFPNVNTGGYTAFDTQTFPSYRLPKTIQVSQHSLRSLVKTPADEVGLLTRNSIPVSKDLIHPQTYNEAIGDQAASETERIDTYDPMSGVPRRQASFSKPDGQ